jgi:hypothetical protein
MRDVRERIRAYRKVLDPATQIGIHAYENLATSPSSSAVSAVADVWISRSGEPSNSRRFPTSEIRGSRSDSRRSPKTENPRLVSTSAYGPQ